MKNLPYEMLLEITKFSEIKDIFYFTQTCKHINNCLFNNKTIFWNELGKRDFKNKWQNSNISSLDDRFKFFSCNKTLQVYDGSLPDKTNNWIEWIF